MFSVPLDRDVNGMPDDHALVAPQPGDVMITEILQNPDAVHDDLGEWFEIYNTTAYPTELVAELRPESAFGGCGPGTGAALGPGAQFGNDLVHAPGRRPCHPGALRPRRPVGCSTA